MSNYSFDCLNPVAFLQTFVSQCVELAQESGGCADRNGVSYIEQIGLSAGKCFEAAYRDEFGLQGPLDAGQYAQMIVAIKNKIGGNFSPASSVPGVVHVVNTRCPFGDAVAFAPELCKMTSSVFGGIAARNFGYAKVVLARRLAANDRACEVLVITDRAEAGRHEGDEYHFRRGKIVGVSATTEGSARIEERMGKLCKGAVPGGTARRFWPVARAPRMCRVLETVEVVAPTKATVLITGETGVGKELIARAIHAASDRSGGGFVAVNCGAIPENLIESALFGHEKGAFTGAYEVHHGFFERAQRGTLFLDEIDSLPLFAQVRLLRVLQEEEFERVGGKQTLSSDVRVIAAGNGNIEEMVKQGRFRLDLFYRLNVVPIRVPSLRERPEDIAPLVGHILGRLSEKYRKKTTGLSASAMEQAQAYPWPGNVRELENVLERSFLFSPGPLLERLDLPALPPGGADAADPLADKPWKEAKKQLLGEAEKDFLDAALRRYGGDVSEVAKWMGLTPRAIYMKLRHYRMDCGGYRRQVRQAAKPRRVAPR